MWWKKKKTVKENPQRDKIAAMIANRIVSVQSRIALRLSRVEKRCTGQQKKIILLLFCLVFGGACLYVLIKGVTTRIPSKQLYLQRSRGSPVIPGFENAHSRQADTLRGLIDKQ